MKRTKSKWLAGAFIPIMVLTDLGAVAAGAQSVPDAPLQLAQAAEPTPEELLLLRRKREQKAEEGEAGGEAKPERQERKKDREQRRQDAAPEQPAAEAPAEEAKPERRQRREERRQEAAPEQPAAEAPAEEAKPERRQRREERRQEAEPEQPAAEAPAEETKPERRQRREERRQDAEPEQPAAEAPAEETKPERRQRREERRQDADRPDDDGFIETLGAKERRERDRRREASPDAEAPARDRPAAEAPPIEDEPAAETPPVADEPAADDRPDAATDRDRPEAGPDGQPTREQLREELRQRERDARDRRRERREERRGDTPGEPGELRDDAEQRRGDGREEGRSERNDRIGDIREERRERRVDGELVIVEPDGRTIVRRGDRTIIRYNELERLEDFGDSRTERRGDETWVIVERPNGVRIITVTDEEGRVIRRIRRNPEGREFVLFENDFDRRDRERYDVDVYVDLPPPVIEIPEEQYIVEAESATPEVIYDTFAAPPVAPMERRYSLEQVVNSPDVLERVRRIDLDTITFETGSWTVTESQIERLDTIGQAINDLLAKNPNEVFLIEGHTDAVGSDIDNLSLSDRRAEEVAYLLTEYYKVPPENLTTKGYGEAQLKVRTEEASRENRRVTMRRITELLETSQATP